MSVSGIITTVSYTGDGSTTDFAVTFPFQGSGSNSELTVVERNISTGVETTKTYTTHYTVTGGNGATGTVIAGTAPASSVQWHFRRNTTTTQTTDYVTNDPFAADTIEGDFDRLAMSGQERDSDIGQAFKYPDTYTGGASATMPEPVASAYLLYNAAADALETSTASAAQYLGGNGTVLLPFYSFSSDPNTGIYRIGADNLGFSVNGVKGLDLSTTGLAVTGTLSATAITGSGILSIDATTESTSGTTGSIHTDGGVGIAKKLHVIGTTTHGGDVLSDTDSTDSLGSTGTRWLKLWTDSIQTTADIDVGADLTIAGDLTVNGTTTTVDSTNTVIKDPLIELNTGASSNANDLGLIMERGSTGNNVFMGWDESGDYFAFGTTTATGASTGNISYSFGEIRASGAVLSGTSSNLGTVTTVDINGGTLDGSVIGGASAAAITGTTLTANTSITLATGGAMTGVLDSDTMTGATAALLSTSESIKAYVDNTSKAAGISMTWETTTTDTDQGVGKVWANNSTLSSATVLYFDDVERNSVSINALIDSLDNPTASNSATIYIQEAGSATAGVLFLVSGAVTSASTYSKVAVTHQATFGTLSDGDVVGVTFAFSGDDGADGGVSSVAAGTGMNFSTITGTGTVTAHAASATQVGVAELATDAEAITGTDTGRVLTPANLTAVLQAPGKFTGMTKGGDITSASPLVIDTDGDMFDVTGTTNHAAHTVAAGRLYYLQFDAALTVTHGGSMVLPGGANLTTAAGDVWTCYSTAANTVIVTNVATAAAAGGGGADVQNFTSSGTWTKPSGAVYCVVEGWGGGGGGGSGRRGAAGSNRAGGGGGGGAAYMRWMLTAAELGSTETITVAAGGAAGAAITGDNTNGNNGAVGGNTTVGSKVTFWGGGKGGAGDATRGYGGGGGGPLNDMTDAGTINNGGNPYGFSTNNGGGFGGGQGSADGTDADAGGWGGGGGGASDPSDYASKGGKSVMGGAGGGGGGFVNSSNTGSRGYDGGYSGIGRMAGAASTTSNSKGGQGAEGGYPAGSDNGDNAAVFAEGGGGGSGNPSGAAGSGGTGFQRGGGGGGGGACVNGNNSGAGGAGGAGFLRITTWS
jgi:hypothetical protein